MSQDDTMEPELEGREWVEVRGRDLASILTHSPGLVPVVDEVLERATTEEIGPATMRRIGFGLIQVLGSEVGGFLGQYLGQDNPAEWTEWVQEAIEPEEAAQVIPAMRRWQALFGFPVAEALRVEGADTGDWTRFSREVMFDTIDNRWVLKSRIIKGDGEEFEIEASPDSQANLVGALLRSLNFVSPGGHEYNEEYLSTLLSEVASFVGRNAQTHPDLVAQFAAQIAMGTTEVLSETETTEMS